jgi:hypothetical protein
MSWQTLSHPLCIQPAPAGTMWCCWRADHHQPAAPNKRRVARPPNDVETTNAEAPQLTPEPQHAAASQAADDATRADQREVHLVRWRTAAGPPFATRSLPDRRTLTCPKKTRLYLHRDSLRTLWEPPSRRCRWARRTPSGRPDFAPQQQLCPKGCSPSVHHHIATVVQGMARCWESQAPSVGQPEHSWQRSAI